MISLILTPLARTHTESLNPYTHKPDCFKRAAGRIRSFCGDFDNDGMNEEERIHGMVSYISVRISLEHFHPCLCYFPH